MTDRFLAIDTATEACSVALISNGVMEAGIFEMLERGHAERLIPMIAELPEKGRAPAIVVNCGPGSFTGVRVGLAAAKALAIAWNVPVNAYNTPSLIAKMALGQSPSPVLPDIKSEAVIVAMSGGHGEYFIQTFDHRANSTRELSSLKPDIAAQLLVDRVGTKTVIAGSAAESLHALLGIGTALPLWPDARCAGILDISQRDLPAEPVYGRKPDAKVKAA